MHKQLAILHSKRRTSGFTIIELLIVIVVIGVLASILAIAFSGITQRTENQKTITAVSQAVRLMLIYKEQNSGNYPSYTSSMYTCIGTGYQDGICHDATTSGYGITSREDSAFNGSLRALGGLPQPSTKNLTMSVNGNIVAGIEYVSGNRGIYYYLQGDNQPCVVSGSVGYNYGNVTQCRIFLS